MSLFVCKKCRFQHVKVKYVTICEAHSPVVGKDHLHLECDRCGYKWWRHTLDSIGTKKALA